MAGYPHMTQHFSYTSQRAHLLPWSLVDGAARIFSYLLCRERESNSHQFSCTSFEGPWSWDALSTELSRPRRPNIDQTYDLEASFNNLVHKLGRYSSQAMISVHFLKHSGASKSSLVRGKKITWSRVFPATSIPFTSRTSSLTASRPVLSAKPPASSREIKMPGTFSSPFGVTRTEVPSLM